MDLISVTTKRNENKGIMAITFVLEEAQGLPARVYGPEKILPLINPERRRIIEGTGWENYIETLFQIVPQPHGRVHVHFAYQRRS